jgi:uncharacterized small protein (DUF1192 family)
VQYSLTELGRRIGRLLDEFQNLEADSALRDVRL